MSPDLPSLKYQMVLLTLEAVQKFFRVKNSIYVEQCDCSGAKDWLLNDYVQEKEPKLGNVARME